MESNAQTPIHLPATSRSLLPVCYNTSVLSCFLLQKISHLLPVFASLFCNQNLHPIHLPSVHLHPVQPQPLFSSFLISSTFSNIMPEGLTYMDMRRILIAQIPPGPYRIQSHEEFHRKNQFPGGDPILLEPYYHKDFSLNPLEIETWGKAIAFSLPSRYSLFFN